MLFKSLLVALSTYSALPVPQFEWNERNMKYAICFFPAVGVLCGAALWAWLMIAGLFSFGSFLFATVATGIPLLITGGIHMDGYMDTVDALASHQSRERKLEILKDPNCGAFAVIYCVVYLLIYTGLMYELFNAKHIFTVCPIFILSRSLSGACAVCMPNARKGGMLCAYTENTEKNKALAALGGTALLGIAMMVVISPVVGGISAAFAIISVLLYYKIAMKQFGGVTGDTSGFFLQICEAACLLGAWIGTYVL